MQHSNTYGAFAILLGPTHTLIDFTFFTTVHSSVFLSLNMLRSKFVSPVPLLPQVLRLPTCHRSRTSTRIVLNLFPTGGTVFHANWLKEWFNVTIPHPNTAVF